MKARRNISQLMKDNRDKHALGCTTSKCECEAFVAYPVNPVGSTKRSCADHFFNRTPQKESAKAKGDRILLTKLGLVG